MSRCAILVTSLTCIPSRLESSSAGKLEEAEGEKDGGPTENGRTGRSALQYMFFAVRYTPPLPSKRKPGHNR